jgi:hypothetical protein
MIEQKPKQLADLPHFKIEEIVPVRNRDVRLAGNFNHLSGVREGRSWLYAPRPSIIGDLIELIPENKSAVFNASILDFTPKIEKGMIFPWIDGYWNSNLIEKILNKNKLWIRTKFEPDDAMAFSQNGVKGWQKSTQSIPKGSKSLGIISKGWDHEHCEICNGEIGAKGNDFGYVSNDDFWLCPDCYEKYGARHDLSFMDAS